MQANISLNACIYGKLFVPLQCQKKTKVQQLKNKGYEDYNKAHRDHQPEGYEKEL